MTASWTLLVLAAAALAVAAPASADDAVDLAVDGDAGGDVVAASLAGNASCSGRNPGLPVSVPFINPSTPCMALSLDGAASCDSLLCVAAAGTGPAEASDGAAVSVLGDADGPWAASSGGGDASSSVTAVSLLGEATSDEVAAASVTGDAEEGEGLAVSVLGDADGPLAAVSGAGEASSWGQAVSLLGDAHGDELAVAGVGDASGDLLTVAGVGDASGDEVAVAGAGDARADDAAASGTGRADAGSGPAVSVLDEAHGRDAAVSGTEDAEASDGAAVSVLGDANGGRVAASGTGEADARFLAASLAGNATSECDAHPPITIVGDSGPTGFGVENPVTGAPIHRPGSGVVAGNGTEDNPYVISGWCIWDAETGIRIVGTTDHVVVRGNDLRNHRTGIEVVAAENVTLRDNAMLPPPDRGRALGPGVHLLRTGDVRVEGNGIADHATGVRTNATTGTAIVQNHVLGSANHGIDAEGGTDAAIRGNTVSGGDAAGIRLHGLRDARLAGNLVKGHEASGIRLNATNATEVVDNTVKANDVHGIATLAGTDVQVRRNTLENNGAGLGTYQPWPAWYPSDQGLVLEDNTVSGNLYGIISVGDSGLRVHGNAIDDNQWTGLLLLQSDGTVVAENRVERHGGVFREGILVWDSNDTSVEGNLIERNRIGLEAVEATNLSVVGNELPRNGDAGVALTDGTAHVDVRGNGIARARLGVFLDDPKDVAVEGNTITMNHRLGIGVAGGFDETRILGNSLAGNPDDVRLAGAEGVLLEDNAMETGLVVDGDEDDHFRHDVAPSNTVDGDPLRYVHDAHQETVSGPAGQVVVAVSENVTVEDVAVDGPRRPVHVVRSANTTLRNASLAPNPVAVLASESPGTTVTSSRVANGTVGVYAGASPGLEVAGSGFSNVTHAVVALGGSNGSLVHDNAFAAVGNATVVQRSDDATVRDNTVRDARNGVLVFLAENATVRGNTGDGDRFGVGIVGGSSHVLVGNDLSFDLVDVLLQRTRDATIFENAMERGLYVLDGDPAGWKHEVAANNTVRGDPLRYVRDDGEDVTAPAGQVVVAEAGNVTVEGVDLDAPVVGVQAWDAPNLTVRDADVRNASRAVEAHATDNLTVRDSHLENATWGVLAFPFVEAPVSDDLVLRDTVLENVTFGLVHHGDRPLARGTTFDGSDFATHLPAVSNPRLEDVTVRGTRVGLSLPGAHGGVLAGNDLSTSLLDVNLHGASGFTVTGNTMSNGLRINDHDPGSHAVDETNTVGGKPVRYVTGVENATVASGAGQVFLAGATNVTVDPQTMDGPWFGVRVIDSEQVTVESPEIVDARVAVSITNREREGPVAVTGGNLSGNFRGLWSDDVTGLTVSGTVASDNRDGITSWDARGTFIHNNTVEHNEENGTLVDGDDPDVVLRDNQVSGNGRGIWLPGSEGAEVHGNNVEDNDLGLEGSTHWWVDRPIDATGNWWGCPDGPSDPACDDVRSGAAVVDPWLTSPNPEAGAG